MQSLKKIHAWAQMKVPLNENLNFGRTRFLQRGVAQNICSLSHVK